VSLVVVAQRVSPRVPRILVRCDRCRGEIVRRPVPVVSRESLDSPMFLAGTFCAVRCALDAALSMARGEG
jgi:hypothetical protein